MATPESPINKDIAAAPQQAEQLDARLAREKLLLDSAWSGIKDGVKEIFIDRPVTSVAKAAISVGVGFAMARILPTRGLIATGAKLFLAEQGASFLTDVGTNITTLGSATLNAWGDTQSQTKSAHDVHRIFKHTITDGALMMAGGAFGHRLGSRGLLALKDGQSWGLTDRLLGRNRINLAQEPEIASLYNNASQAVFRIKSLHIAQHEGLVAESGTGFFLDNKGNALTAAHVVKGMGERHTVVLESGKKLSAYVLAMDRTNDLALLRVVGKEVPTHHLKLGAEPVKGSKVLGIGYPGESHGLQVVSPGKFEDIHMRADRFAPSTPIKEQKFSGQVRGGQSGGPVLDQNGEVVGVITIAEHLPSGKTSLFTPSQDVVANFVNNWKDTMARSTEDALGIANSLRQHR